MTLVDEKNVGEKSRDTLPLNLHYRDQHVALYNILYISSVRNGLEYWLWWTRLISVWFGMVLQLSAGTNPLTRGRHFFYFLMRFFVSIQVTPTCLSAIMLKNNIFMPRFFSTLPVLHCYLLLSRHCSLKKNGHLKCVGQLFYVAIVVPLVSISKTRSCGGRGGGKGALSKKVIKI